MGEFAMIIGLQYIQGCFGSCAACINFYAELCILCEFEVKVS
jgi:hypothetical protein